MHKETTNTYCFTEDDYFDLVNMAKLHINSVLDSLATARECAGAEAESLLSYMLDDSLDILAIVQGVAFPSDTNVAEKLLRLMNIRFDTLEVSH